MGQLLPRTTRDELAEPALEMIGVRKTFGSVVAVDRVDLSIDYGEIVGIIGPSGSGKTTTIRLLLGLYVPSEGVVRVNGRDPALFNRTEREHLGYLPQHFLLYPELTVQENLSFVASAYGIGWLARRQRIPELLDMVRLADARSRLAADLSGGMQRRLALASALVHDPPLLVLDEPTAGIDPVLRSSIWETFRTFRDEGRCLVVTTQYVTEAEYCDRVLLIDDGRVIASGTPHELRTLAFGGDLVEVTIPDLDRRLVAELLRYPYVRRAEWMGNDQALLVVESAGEAMVRLPGQLRDDYGAAVTAIEEHEEPFDRVFVELVENNGNQQTPAA